MFVGKQKFGVPLTPAIIERRLSELFAHQTAIVSDLYEQLRDFSRRFNEARNLRHQHAAEQVAASVWRYVGVVRRTLW